MKKYSAKILGVKSIDFTSFGDNSPGIGGMLHAKDMV